MNVVELVKKAEELMDQRQVHLAFKTYLLVIDYYRRNKKKVEVDENVLTAYNNAVVLGMYLAESRNDLIKMRDLAREFVKVVKKTNNSEMYAVACFHAGVAHNALQEYKNAVEFLEEALVVFELIGHEEGVMLASKNLAEAYRGLGLQTKAEICHNRAEAIAKKLGERGKSFLKETSFLLKKWFEIPWVIRR